MMPTSQTKAVCGGCGIPINSRINYLNRYMLKPFIWRSINQGHTKGFLCWDCMLKRHRAVFGTDPSLRSFSAVEMNIVHPYVLNLVLDELRELPDEETGLRR